MQRFPRQAAIRIAAASLCVAMLVATIAWFWAREQAEEEVVALAKEEAQQFLRHFGASDLSREVDTARVADAAKVIVGGIFDIVEIYDPTGLKLAEATTEAGRQVEALLPKHQRPTYSQAHYESKTLPDGRWVLRVFVPLRNSDAVAAPVTGYLEGVRVVADWQRAQIEQIAWGSALLAGVAALLCGALIYLLDGAHEVVAAHHEKWDGSGYPRGLRAEAIPLAARIFAVADVFDALCSKRPYKEPLPFELVLVMIQADSGRHFDPAVVSTFCKIADEIRARLVDGSETTARTLLEACIRRHFAVST